jgi:hypothetical protein
MGSFVLAFWYSRIRLWNKKFTHNLGPFGREMDVVFFRQVAGQFPAQA